MSHNAKLSISTERFILVLKMSEVVIRHGEFFFVDNYKMILIVTQIGL